ncbi:hypothetical protein LCGC14_2639620, partial [marine sediment metagenome]
PNSSLSTTGLVGWLPINEDTGTDIYSINETTSRVFTDGIIGATYLNDAIDVTLTNGTDYNVGGNIFTTINQDLAWTQINATYFFGSSTSTSTTTILRLTGIFLALSFIIFLLIPIVILIKNKKK